MGIAGDERIFADRFFDPLNHIRSFNSSFAGLDAAVFKNLRNVVSTVPHKALQRNKS